MYRVSRASVAWTVPVGAVVAGLASLLIARPIGFDAYAWMVWARELAHGTLSTVGGPAIKPLPVLVMAPLTFVSGAAPIVWLAAMRITALLSVIVAYRLGARLGGWIAGATTAILVAAEPDIYRTALYGSSEPLLVLLVLLAAARWIDGRPAPALALLGVAGLIRPELWPLVGVMAIVFAVREGRVRPMTLIAATAPPAIWLGLSWAGSGSAVRAFASLPSFTSCGGCGVLLETPRALVRVSDHPTALGVLSRLGQSITPPAIAMAALVAVRRTDDRARLLVIGAVAVAWVLIVAAMAQAGYPGSRRYLAGPAVLLAVLAGVGTAAAIHSAATPRRRWMTGALVVGVITLAEIHTVVSDARLVGTARRVQHLQADLRQAIRLAGGRSAVLTAGRPAVNPWFQTVLAWDLSVGLSHIQPTWDSSRSDPGWTPPAVVFRGPRRLAGPRPVLGRRPTTVLLRYRGWVLRRSGT